jgi:hypothetical protein
MKPFTRRLALTVALLQVPLAAIGQEAKHTENVPGGRTYTPEYFAR